MLRLVKAAVATLVTQGMALVGVTAMGAMLFKSVITSPARSIKDLLSPPLRKRPEAFADPGWKHGFLQLSDVTLHYVEVANESSEGDRPLLLMLHGFPECWWSWKDQLPVFAKDYRAVALDMRGFSESSKPTSVEAYHTKMLVEDVRQAILKLGYKNCVLVGHDWGAAVAMEFAARHPDMLRGLVVSNGVFMTAMVQSKFKFSLRQRLLFFYMLAFQMRYVPELLWRLFDYRAVEESFRFGSFDRDVIPTSSLDVYKWNASLPGALTAMINYYRAVMIRVKGFTPKEPVSVNVPSLAIWGLNDPIVLSENLEPIRWAIPHIRIRPVVSSGHWVQQEQPEAYNRLLSEFLSEIYPKKQ